MRIRKKNEGRGLHESFQKFYQTKNFTKTRQQIIFHYFSESIASICYFRLRKQSCTRTNKKITIYTHILKHLSAIDKLHQGWKSSFWVTGKHKLTEESKDLSWVVRITSRKGIHITRQQREGISAENAVKLYCSGFIGDRNRMSVFPTFRKTINKEVWNISTPIKTKYMRENQVCEGTGNIHI